MKKNLFFILFVLPILLLSCSDDNEKEVITSVKIEQSTLQMKVGEESQLKFSYSPEHLKKPVVEWISSDADVATVNASGIVKAIKAGNTTILLRASIEGGNILESKCTVRISNVDATSIIMQEKEKTLMAGESAELKYIIEPDNTTNKQVEWYSDDEKIASVADGKVTALTSGVTYIYVKIKNTQTTDKCKITVNPIRVSGIKISQKELNLEKGNSFNLNATITPENASNKGYKWIASNTNISISAAGLVVGNAIGTALAVVESEDGAFRDTCKVSVKPLKGGLYFDESSYYVVSNYKCTIPINITVDYTPQLVWTSSNSNMPIENGILNALTAGKSHITAEIKSENSKAECDVNAVAPEDAVTVEANINSLNFDSNGSLLTFKSNFFNKSLNDICLTTVMLLDNNDQVKQVIKINKYDKSIITKFDPIRAGSSVSSGDLDKYSSWKVVFQFSIGNDSYQKTVFINTKQFG